MTEWKECEECGVKILLDEYEDNEGLCDECYMEEENDRPNSN